METIQWQKCLGSGLLALALAFSQVGCAGQPETSSRQESRASASQPEQQESESQEGKTLVVYFSATGNTAAVAEVIAESTGADLYELVPEEPYTPADLDWNNPDSRVSREHASPDLRPAIAGEAPDLSGYDTIFIGYPIWWGQAPNLVWGFVENSGLSGRTLIPFCTSASSGFGTSGETLAAMAPDAVWLEGRRFGEQLDSDAVAQWVSGLNLAP